MNHSRSRIRAVIEVAVVRFVLIDLLLWGIMLVPGLVEWQETNLSQVFSTHVVFIVVALVVIATRRRGLAAYGVTIENPKHHLSVAALCLIPVVLAGMPLGLGVDHRQWQGALILAGAQVALLVVLAWMLRNRPTRTELGAISTYLLLALPAQAQRGDGFWGFIYYLTFVGFGEEMLYRGYIQSRLNEAFSRPYRFFGVSWGWGIVIAALIFGLTHLGIWNLIRGESSLTWPWAFWTFFSGLVFGFIREKTGSILAPAILHGLPQAVIAVLAL